MQRDDGAEYTPWLPRIKVRGVSIPVYQEFHRVKAFSIAAMRENAGKDILIASLHFLAHPTVSPQLVISNVMSISLSAIQCIAAIGNALTRWNSWYTGMDTPLTLIRGSHGVYSAPSSRYIHTSVTMAYTHTHRVNTGNLASDPKKIEVRRFIRPLLIIGLS